MRSIASSLRRRLKPLRIHLLSVRGRVFLWYLLLLSGFLVISFPIMLHLVFSEINQRVRADLREDIYLFEGLLNNDPQVKQRLALQDTEILPLATPADLVAVFNLYLARRVPEDDTFIIGVIDQDFYRSSPEALPPTLQPNSPLLLRLAQAENWKEGVDPRPNSETGDILFVVLPLTNDQGEIIGRFIAVHAVAGEHREILTSLKIVFATLIGVFCLSIGASAVVAGRVLAPLTLILRTATSINESNLTRRIPITTQGELATLAQAFNSMLDRLETAFEHQRQFLNDVGHELRTPITIIRGHLELMAIAQLPLEEQKTVELVLDELDRMGRLVQELILLAKLERPDFLHYEPIDLEPFVAELYNKITALTPDDRQWESQGVVRGILWGDRQRLTQAIINLAQNAVQYTQSGDRICLTVTQTAKTLQFSLIDSGHGISPADQARIFERFARGRQTRGTEGSGLGLAIAKQVAIAHGGTITVESELNQGSTFTLTIPYDPDFDYRRRT
ncbi:two-component sensor histidine kinase [[Synechococcus] sp. NIES-970]|uniref:sensor histidine kinase n=1 Tax=Picosynechococcus sp. NKBG15041c TaxID=1407650 RepID=UPI00040F5CFC|nr:HAMP domain-containing sensor histidine kinase [Picosynechococcus sp. NKBG15041c]BAW96743.1 two-component sensor histidine kinase [[Synechococcus] sp. NIES-970]